MWAKGWRVPWVLITVGILVSGVLSAMTRMWLPAAIATGLGVTTAAMTGVWTSRATAALTHYDELRRALPDAVRLNAHGRCPLVSELDNPGWLGVHPAASTIGEGRDRYPDFIPRDITPDLAAALQRERFVLLVGESTAGKSRAAYETVRALLGDHRLIEPLDRSTARTAAQLASRTPASVLWLDDLERFLGSDGLTGPWVSNVLSAGEDRFIIATLRSEEHAKFSGRSTTAAFDGIGREALRQGWDVLRLATRIDLPRMWSPAEIARASRVTDDPRIADAVAHAQTCGIAEYLAAGPQLLAEWRDGWAPSAHPRACALIEAAVDARRAGVHRPLPPTVLHMMHESYLERRGGSRLRPEPLDSAMEWATTALYATSSLLIPSAEGYSAFDYLIDAIDKTPVPSDALDALLGFATPDEAMDIGELAWRWNLIDQAQTAFQNAGAAGLFKATERECHLIREERGGSEAAIRFARDALQRVSEQAGPTHPDTFAAHDLVAWEVGHGGDPAAARDLHRELVAKATSVLGHHHRTTLELRFGLAQMVGYAGDSHEAVRQYDTLVADCKIHLGENDELTISAQDEAAWWHRNAGAPDTAVHLLRELCDEASSNSRIPNDQLARLRYRLAACLTEAGHYAQALAEWDQLVAEETAAHGALWLNTLYVRLEQAECIGESGDPDSAVRLLTDLYRDVERLHAPETSIAMLSRRTLAWWTGRAGDLTEAVRQLRELIIEYAARRTETDKVVTALKLRLTYFQAKQHPPHEANQRLENLLAEATKTLEPWHPVIIAIRNDLGGLQTPRLTSQA